MSNNLVTVTAQWTDGTNPAEGNYAFVAQGSLMDSPAVAIVTPVALGQLDATGSLAVPLLASDNFTEGYLTWHVSVRVRGFTSIDVADIEINFANGASQGLFGILEASGWSPPSS